MTENSEPVNPQPTASEPSETEATPRDTPAEGHHADEQAAAVRSPEAQPAQQPQERPVIPEPPGQATDSPDEGWVMESDSDPGPPAASRAEAAATPATGRSKSGERLTRVTLGSALIALDTVNERLERLDDADDARPRTLDDVLVPMSQWPEQFGVSADRPTRHLVLGMMVDARARAGATGRFLNRLGNRLAEAINLLSNPVRTRRVFKPVRQSFRRAVDRGDSQLERWRAMGRAEDARSRALAESALTSAAEETMDELVTNQRIEVFIQDIIEAQTVGIVDEIIEEIRERAVSSDNFFERPVRRLLRRPPRVEIPPPDFDPQLVRPAVRRNQPLRPGSLLGHYAGFTSRLLALLIDVGLIVVILALGSSLLTTAVDVLGLREWFDANIAASGLFTGLLAVVNGLVIVIGYLVLAWLLTGQTLGMMLLGLRVVSRAGGRVTLWRAILRFIGYFLLPGIFFLGFVWILGSDKREAWHDKLAGTLVVYAWDARPDETFLTYGMYLDN